MLFRSPAVLPASAQPTSLNSQQRESWDTLAGATAPLAFEKLSKELSEDPGCVLAWEGALALSSLASRASKASQRSMSRAVVHAIGSSDPAVVWAAILELELAGQVTRHYGNRVSRQFEF